MTPEESAEQIRVAERWLMNHGLPYFVDDRRATVAAALRPRRWVPLAVAAAAVAVTVAISVGWVASDVSGGVLAFMVLLGLAATVYCVLALRVWPIVSWAMRRTLGSLGHVFPLVVRALPLLLLFITFLFINAEVWQVAALMDRALLWVTVLLFGGLAAIFLVARVPTELDLIGSRLEGERLLESCEGTPLQAAAHRLEREVSAADITQVTGLQRLNLVLIVVIAQAVQVLLLALTVFAFFAVFGRMAITPDIVESWIGSFPTYPGRIRLVSTELFQVAVFLAAFSGLYFTVYAITDTTYRDQFFTAVTDELERAVAIRAIYRALHD
jgi:hypothetical protein